MADDSVRNVNNGLPPRDDNSQPQVPWDTFGRALNEILIELRRGDKSLVDAGNIKRMNQAMLSVTTGFKQLSADMEQASKQFKEQADKLNGSIELQAKSTRREAEQIELEMSNRRTMNAAEAILKRGEIERLQKREQAELDAMRKLQEAQDEFDRRQSELLARRETVSFKQDRQKDLQTRLTAVNTRLASAPEDAELIAQREHLESELQEVTDALNEFYGDVDKLREDMSSALRKASDDVRDAEDDFRYSMDGLRDSVSGVSDALGVMRDATSNASGALKSVSDFEEKLNKNNYEKALDAIESSRRAAVNLYNRQQEMYEKLSFAIQNGIDEFGNKLSEEQVAEKKAQLQKLRMEQQITKRQIDFYSKLTPVKDVWLNVGQQLSKVGFNAIKGMANNVASYFTKRFVDDTFDAFNKVYQSIENTRNEISARLRMNQGDFSDMQDTIQQEIESRGLEGVVAQSDVNDALIALTTAGITDREFLREMALESAKLKAQGADIDLTNEETLERFQNLQGQGYSVNDLVRLMETAAGQMQATKDTLGSGSAFIGGGGNTILNQVLDVGTAFGKSVDQMSEDIGSALYSAQAVKLGGADPQMYLEKINSFIENPLGNQDKFTLAWAQRMGYVTDKGTITADDIANMSYDEILGSMNEYMQEIFANQDALLVPYLKDVYGISAPTTQLLRMQQSEVDVKLPDDFGDTVADTMSKTTAGLQNATWVSETVEGLNKRENLMAEQAIDAEKFYKGDVLFNSVTEPVVSALNEIKSVIIGGVGTSISTSLGKLLFGSKLANSGQNPTGGLSEVAGSSGSSPIGGLLSKLNNTDTLKNLLGADTTTVAGKVGSYGGAAVGGAMVIDSIMDADSARDVFTDPEFYAGLSGGIASAIGGPVAGAIVGGLAGLGAKYGNWLGEKSVASDPILEDWNASENALTEAANTLLEAATKQLDATTTEYNNFKKMNPQQKRLMLLQSGNLKAEEANNLSDEEINEKFEELIIKQQEAEIKKQQAEVKRANLLANSKSNLANLEVNLGDLSGMSTEAGSGSASTGLSEQAYRVMQLLGSGTSEQLTSAIFDSMAANEGLSVEAAVEQITEGMGVTAESKAAITQFAREIDKNKSEYDTANKSFQEKWQKAKEAAGTDDITMIALKYAELYSGDTNGNVPDIKTTGASGSFRMDSSEPVFLDSSGLPVLSDNHGTYHFEKGFEGRFATGMTRVPHDNYLALLHEGERVLTAKEAKAYNNISSYAVETIAGDSVNSIANISEANSILESVLNSGVGDTSALSGSIDAQTSTLEQKLDAILAAIQGLSVSLRGTPRPAKDHTDVRRMNSNLTSVNTGNY